MPDYRRVADYHAQTGINDEDYWKLIPHELISKKLPKAFCKDIYVKIHDWFGRRLQIQPLHVRDLLYPHDAVFQCEDLDSGEEDMEVVDLGVNDANIEGVDVTLNIERVRKVDEVRDPFHQSPIRPAPLYSGSRQAPNTLGGLGASNGTPLHGVTPTLRGSTVLLSDSSYTVNKRKLGNTAIRRKASGGASALVEVAKASGEAIATQMKEMASVTKETESNKLEVQLRLFSEQMAYQ